MSGFLAGAAQLDITPVIGTTMPTLFNPRTSVGIHDPLHAKTLVLRAGETTVAIACCDLLCIPTMDVVAARELVEERCGIPGDHVLICATHTHTAAGPGGRFVFEMEPADYHTWLIHRIADAVTMARDRLRPARVAWGAGALPQHVHNRRLRMRDGSVVMNPKRQDPAIVEPAGPTDPTITIAAVVEPNGDPIALVGNYALHYVGGIGGKVFSADYYGEVGRILNERRGAEFPVLWTNGCSGDVNNIDFFSPPPKREPFEQIQLVAADAAAEALRIWEGITPTDAIDVSVAVERFDVPLRRPDPEELKVAKALYADQQAPRDKQWVLAKEMVQASELSSPVPAEVQAIRISDLAIAALPGEIFCQLGLDLKAQSPFDATMVVGLANGYLGYIPTPEALEQGGYETWLARTSCCGAETGPMLVGKAASLVGRLAE